MVKISVSEQTTFTDFDVSNREEALKILSKELLNRDKVEIDFLQNLLEREEKAPTGLSIYDYGIAIPHTEPQYVKEDSVAIAVLKKPIPFYDMVTKSETISVNIIFLLALTESNKHLNILSQIMDLVNKPGAVEELMKMNKEKLLNHVYEKLELTN
ncbi:PTS sugar transporter subunit IIA [Staphylococcus pseudoxylosus]|uniref:PTS sugar transporter subunit IIA n=1 Tax=Staphylococcus pseudoxylosus TaxID=2282419 RepID=A0AAQ0ME12_9STAP|nr:PTS sugar transporter subunit IIA [Staphylococcus pseudoxylosus]MCE5003663.1 PTS sugar transporter subunit IIA [Staphylococcus pseudoxylosus]RMI83884.1 PTS sugar transporter subunit IIA [Staphylococcus pseudoxylosus]